MRPLALLAVLSIGLTACGNQNQGATTRTAVAEAVTGLVSRVAGRGAQTTAAPTGPSPAEIRAMAAQGPVLLVEVPGLGLNSPATPAAVNGYKATWVAGPATVTLQSGFLIATRGLGQDLMAVEVEGFGSALASGGRYSRQMEWLNGRDQFERVSFDCTVTPVANETVTVLGRGYSAVRHDDVCVGGGLQFTNSYWIDSSKQLRQTKQWISRQTGYLRSQQVN